MNGTEYLLSRSGNWHFGCGDSGVASLDGGQCPSCCLLCEETRKGVQYSEGGASTFPTQPIR